MSKLIEALTILVVLAVCRVRGVSVLQECFKSFRFGSA